MSTTTTNYGLIKPDTTDPILVGQLNDNADVIDATLKSLSDALDVAKLGIKYKGEVNYYSNLPSSGNQIGDAYTVKYAGSSGTTPDGTEYVWGTVSGTNQWINFSKDSYTKAEVDALLALKVDTAGTGLSKSGTTLNHSNSTTAKTTQGFAQIAYDAQGHITGSTAATTAQANAINSGIDSTKVGQIETNKNNILFNTNQGVKNLFNLTKVSGTYSTVVFTVNSDKTVTVNGTASPANSVFNLDDWTCTKAGTYVISGAPSGGSWTPSPNTYRIRVAVNGTWKGDDVGNGFALTLALGDVVNLQINTSTSYTANNLVFKPMITLKSLYDADPTYQPYAMSNAELTAAIQALQAQLNQ